METLFIGKNTIFLTDTESTNSYAIGLLKNVNLPEGTVVHAAVQHAGKGQRNSAWIAEPHCNLTVSVLLKPGFLKIADHFFLYKIAALACVDTLSCFLDVRQFDIQIKWPNDILVNGRKICGILIENTVSGDQVRNSVIGVGININQERFEGIPNATSYRLLTGKSLVPGDVLARLCASLEALYLMLREGRSKEISRRYLDRMYGLDHVLPFEIDRRVRHLRVRGIHASGLLELEDETGRALQADVKQVTWLLPQ